MSRRHPLALARAIPVVIALALSAGCSGTPHKTLYAWEGYPTTLYQHLRSPSADAQAQIAAMELDLQKMLAADGAPPPGFRAHLGYLYFAAGADEKAIANLQAEQQAFPEFAPYMKFMMSQYQKK
ncbi:MAG: DUF4810 domain-containing protein [Burkholderiaceae bacterium]|nr:DUF4810 domain-containing protein [Burkholderiaceae bacterium]